MCVAIPTFGREEVLLSTIQAVLAQSPPADEIIVVDQTSAHSPNFEIVLEEFQRKRAIRYIRQSPPNLPAARNRALDETECDVVVFIDDDVELYEGFVEAHRQNYISCPGLAAVAGRVTRKLPWQAAKSPQQWPRAMDFRFFDFDGQERVEDIANFNGANHSVQVSTARKYGGYDVKFTGVALREDTDLALRLFLGGEKVVFDPSAHLYHLFAPMGGCRVEEWGDFTIAQNLIYFSRKHRQALAGYGTFELWRAYRLGVLNRSNLWRPRQLFEKTLRFVIALRNASRAAV